MAVSERSLILISTIFIYSVKDKGENKIENEKSLNQDNNEVKDYNCSFYDCMGRHVCCFSSKGNNVFHYFH